MSFYQHHPRHQPFETALAPFLQTDGLPFADVLPARDVQQAFDDAGVGFGNTERSVFNPAITLWAFLSQVLGANKSCRAAVLRVVVLLVALGRRPCAVDTAAYCRARAKIPVVVLRRLARQVGQRLDDTVPDKWLWKKRHVHLVDGFTVSAPDTEANQKKYPQSRKQKPGIGFPILRLVIILSLATATAQDLAMGPYSGKETGETALLRQLLANLRVGTVILADRYYCSYVSAHQPHRGARAESVTGHVGGRRSMCAPV
jgi:putative transposase